MCRCPPSSETVNGGNGCSYMYASDFATDWPNGQPEGSRTSAFITARCVRALELFTTNKNLAKGSNCASRTTLASPNLHSSKPRLLWRVVDATCIALKFRRSTLSLTVESFAKKMDSGCQMHKQSTFPIVCDICCKYRRNILNFGTQPLMYICSVDWSPALSILPGQRWGEQFITEDKCWECWSGEANHRAWNINYSSQS